VNELDCKWGASLYNFWETKLTFEKSYLARLNYVHQNAVKHGGAGCESVSMVFCCMV
jgi:putative transposase